MFKGILITKDESGYKAAVQQIDDAVPPEGDVTVRVEWSTLNYKDGLVLNGLGRLVKTYPHVGGVDFVGTVLESQHPDYKAGDQVILTGWRVGEVHWGGYAEKARVKGEWLVALPKGLSTERAMAIGTAGLEPLALAADYALILVVRYMNLPLIRELTARLAPGGYLVCEQHLVTAADVVGPSDPAFRVRPGEQAQLAQGLRLHYREEALTHDPDQRPVALARLVAQRLPPAG